jgi:peptidoglycan/xylan/chitin deacetylase (PgdA/CDA1 family)
MTVSPSAFAAQLEYLASHDYHVIRLADLVDFMAGALPLPKRSVVITFDDGYASTYRYGYPLLRKYGFPATVFVYTDFAGAGDAMSWSEMKEMVASGLIDIQAHSKTHPNLTERLPGESDEAYRKRVDSEIVVPRDLLRRHLSEPPVTYAYPYGDANEIVAERVAKAGYRLAATVNPGGNPFFAYPLMLHRSMIFGDHDLEDFKARLQVFATFDQR